MLTIGSLFSGIGGLELGLEWAGLGPTIWQVEFDPFCRQILANHWPDADRSVIDVRRANKATLAPVDLICGGFPCQDVSAAGAGAGITGRRSGLWFEFERIIWQLAPRWVVVENVGSAAIQWVDDVVEGLDCLGYTAVPFPLSAEDVGAWHIRRRVFVVAHSNRKHLRLKPGRRSRSSRTSQAQPGHDGEARRTADIDSQSANITIRSQEKHSEPRRTTRRSPKPGMVRGVYGLPAWLDFARAEGIEPINHERQPDDIKRRRALGNSVVPQCAEVIGWIVRELEGV